MLEVAAILSAFAATTGAFLRSGDRWPRGAAPSSAMRMILAATVPLGLGASLALVAAALLEPTTLLAQWLLAIRITAASMFLLASLGLATSTSTFLPAVAGGIGVLLAALTSALAGRPGPIPDRGETAPIRRG
jgi:hypothetical protein